MTSQAGFKAVRMREFSRALDVTALFERLRSRRYPWLLDSKDPSARRQRVRRAVSVIGHDVDVEVLRQVERHRLQGEVRSGERRLLAEARASAVRRR